MKRLLLISSVLAALASAGTASASDPYFCTVTVPSAHVLFFVHASDPSVHNFCSNFRGVSGYRVTIQSSWSTPFSWQQRAAYYTPDFGFYAQVFAPRAYRARALRLAARMFPAYDAWRRVG
jgi:hypothetical protein